MLSAMIIISVSEGLVASPNFSPSSDTSTSSCVKSRPDKGNVEFET